MLPSLFLAIAAPRLRAGDAPGGRSSGLAGEPEHAELFERWAGTLVDASAKLGVEDVIYLAEKPEVDAKRMTGKSTTGRGRQGVRQARRRRRRRRRLHRADRAWDLRRPRREVQPAGARPDAGRFRAAAEEVAVASRRVREHCQRQRAVHRSAGRARPDDRDGDAHRRRALRDALWRLLRRRARGHRRRRGQESAGFSARGVQLREARSRDGLRARRHHVDRARAAERQRRRRHPGSGRRRQAGQGRRGAVARQRRRQRSAAGRPESPRRCTWSGASSSGGSKR